MKQEILNEFYFGKSSITKYLEDSLDCFMAIIQNTPNMRIQKKLNKINEYIKPIIKKNIEEKNNFLNGYDKTNPNSKVDHMNNIMRYPIPSIKDSVNKVKNSVDTIMSQHTIQKEIDLTKLPVSYIQLIQYNIFIIENLIRIIFGYNMVFIKLTEPRPGQENTFIVNISTFPIVRRSNKKFIDDFGRHLDNDEIINSINIMNHGIFIDWRKYAISLMIFLPIKVIQNNIFTSSEFLAILLHEIGHTFSKLLTPHINLNITKRQDEKFADKMVSLYGYSNELISGLAKINFLYHKKHFEELNIDKKIKDKKEIANHIYTNVYENRKTGIPEKKLKQNIEIINNNLNFLYNKLNQTDLTPLEKNLTEIEIDRLEEIKDNLMNNASDPHPLVYIRMWDQLKQLISELNSQHNTNVKKKKIIDDINKIKQSIRDYYKGNFNNNFMNNDKDIEDFKAIDHEIRKIIHRGGRRTMKTELENEYDSPLSAEKITDLFDSLHVNTKRKALIVNNFTQFWKEYMPENKNKATNPNICTKLFEKYLVAKYEKYDNEDIYEYCQRIARMKIIEICYMRFTFDYKKNIKISNGISKKLLSDGIYNTEFQYTKLKDKDYDEAGVIDFIYDNIIKENKVFISQCIFNSDGDLEDIEYDPDELERIKGIYQKYYT